jgi:hypothetical protein
MRVFAAVFGSTLLAMVAALLLWRIWPLLPQHVGGEMCFTAKYDPPRPLHLISRHPDRRTMGGVKSMSVRIWLPPEEQPYRDERSGQSYDWRYSLHLRAELASGEVLSTASICEWSNTFAERTILPVLECYIDCEGGSVSAWRRIGRNSLSVRFEAKEHLKSDSCGSVSAVFMGADSEALSFPLDAVEPERCKDRR